MVDIVREGGGIQGKGTNGWGDKKTLGLTGSYTFRAVIFPRTD